MLKKMIALFLPKEGKTIHSNRYMFLTCFFFVLLFFGLMGYLIRFMILDSDKVIANPYNRRTENLTQHILRGKIISADGETLAESRIDEEGKEKRIYPHDREYAHVVGYSSHGQSGLESAYNYDLLTSHTDLRTQLMNGINGIKNPGDNIITTLDSRLQEAAYNALGDYHGAIVAIEPSTGKIRAMVSKPDYNPNTLDDIWSEIVGDASSSVLLNRASQGLYPPGSTYKVITALEYVTEHLHSYHDFTYNCKGETVVNSVKIHCYKETEHGKEDLEQAFAHSCNTAFVTLGCKLNVDNYIRLNHELLFDQNILFDLPLTKSRFRFTEKSEESDLPQTVIGQGETLMTPLHNALIMCAIANNGIMMRPMLVDKITAADGVTVREHEPKVQMEMEQKEALPVLKTMLEKAVTEGTAAYLQDEDYTAAGKTGTAENEKEKPHSWFVGYSNVEKPDLVVCVIAENTGTGSDYAVPIAKDIFDAYYENKE